MSEKTEGFDTIADVMKKQYPDQNGLYYGTLLPYRLGGNDPLDGVEIWKSEKGMPHWHYVTYGFTELYDKESDDPQVSGYGIELTFRLKRGNEEEPPVWPVNLLQNLARYVFSSGNVFGSGHHLDCNGPVALEEDTLLTALAFRVDPELGEMDTPNGHMVFLQAAAITRDELDAMVCWNVDKALKEMEKYIPLCITVLDRPSLMENPAFHKAWETGVEADGSSTGFLYVEKGEVRLEDGRGTLTLGAICTKNLPLMLRARIGKGRELFIQSRDAAFSFRPGSQSGIEKDGELYQLTLTEQALSELCALLQPHAGSWQLTSMPLTLKLEPTEILDSDGKVTEVIR